MFSKIVTISTKPKLSELQQPQTTKTQKTETKAATTSIEQMIINVLNKDLLMLFRV